MKIVKAVPPYIHKQSCNFKFHAYKAWQESGCGVVKSRFPAKILHGLVYKIEPPVIYQHSEIALLMFAEPVSLYFDTYPYAMTHEIIPFFWDCWPMYHDKIVAWIKRHKVRTAIFTSAQVACIMRKRLPGLNVIEVREGIDTSFYDKGKALKERNIDVFEIGSVTRSWYKKHFPSDYSRLSVLPDSADLSTQCGFSKVLQDTKVTVMFPRCYTQPDMTGNIETMTQRYWEVMLSRMLMIGRAPEELVKFIGYNPVIDIDMDNPTDQIKNILLNIDSYQQFVDRNRETALRFGDWSVRMSYVKESLCMLGYIV